MWVDSLLLLALGSCYIIRWNFCKWLLLGTWVCYRSRLVRILSKRGAHPWSYSGKTFVPCWQGKTLSSKPCWYVHGLDHPQQKSDYLRITPELRGSRQLNRHRTLDAHNHNLGTHLVMSGLPWSGPYVCAAKHLLYISWTRCPFAKHLQRFLPGTESYCCCLSSPKAKLGQLYSWPVPDQIRVSCLSSRHQCYA